MLNPAWQPNHDQVERLLDISHHFLSDRVMPDSPAAVPDFGELPVLLVASKGISDAPAPQYLLHALNRQLNLPGQATEHTWHLTPRTEPDLAADTDLVLLLVDATLEDTRAAYLTTKRLAQRGVNRIGVLFRCGSDNAAARRCYRRLAVGTIRFLNLTLLNLGCLPNPGPHFAAALAHSAQVIRSQQQAQAAGMTPS